MMNSLAVKHSYPKRSLKHVALIFVPLAAAATLTGAGLHATFTDIPQSVETTATTGKIDLYVGSGGEEGYTTTVQELLPGQSQTAFIDVNNIGSLPFSKIEAKIEASGELVDSPAPVRDYKTINDKGEVVEIHGTGGAPATIAIESCDTAWVNNTCGNSHTDYTTTRPAGTSPVWFITAAHNLQPGATVYLKITYTLPLEAGQEYEGTTASYKYYMTATQRDGGIVDAR